jgi:hypothetical protein
MLAFVLAALAVVRFGPAVSRNLELVRLQRAAVAYVAPAGAVMCTARHEPPSSRGGKSDDAYGVRDSSPWPWVEFASRARVSTAVAFLGELRRKDGRRRIAVVTGDVYHRPGWMDNGAPLDPGHEQIRLGAYVLRPGTLTGPPAALNATDPALLALVPLGPQVRLYAGRPDPADPSHFTIEYQYGEARGVIDGWLRQDDSIELTVRDGPATPSPR